MGGKTRDVIPPFPFEAFHVKFNIAGIFVYASLVKQIEQTKQVRKHVQKLAQGEGSLNAQDGLTIYGHKTYWV